MATEAAAAPAPTQEIPWHEAFPAPRTKAAVISRSEVLGWLEDPSKKSAPVDFVLVDVRRADHEGGTISTSINLPAQSLYPSIPTLYAIFKQGGIKKVIWYCGSSRGRGTRASGWFADYILEKEGEGAGGMQSLVLEGGIKGWVGAGEEYVEHVVGYEASAWKGTERA
ncbi:oxidoreductase [Blastomyces silverae]|uniref:Oxidoreductase n=1 Tax=Blastomyces silverae TaxID=2060906 RepID=A0A0H1B355_9EURO|nr:oxidoreductase [Blastomyces silverae]